MKLKPTFEQWDINGKPVFLRADLNVPLKQGKVLSDHRLQALLPTLKQLIHKGAIVVLATHIGRPKQQEPELSTQHLVQWFEKKGLPITYCKTIDEAQRAIENAQPGTIVLLENLRFFPGEKSQDEQFAQQLKQLAHYYVNDAFGAAHRSDSSLTLLAKLFPKDKRSIGYIIERELFHLKAIMHPEKPFCVILGGGKVADKLPLIEHFIGKADTLLLCPAIVFTFLKALHKPVGKSLVDPAFFSKAIDIMNNAPKKGTSLHFPLDYYVLLNDLTGALELVDADQIPKNSIGISIGPKSIAAFKPIIQRAKTIFFNGMIGLTGREDTQKGMEDLLREIAQAPGQSVIAGGDSVAIVQRLNLQGIDYCSTGGGAALHYISGHPLSALEPFINK